MDIGHTVLSVVLSLTPLYFPFHVHQLSARISYFRSIYFTAFLTEMFYFAHCLLHSWNISSYRCWYLLIPSRNSKPFTWHTNSLLILQRKYIGVSSDPDAITVFRHSLSSRNYININIGKFSPQFNTKCFGLYCSCHYFSRTFFSIISHQARNRIPWLRFLVLFAVSPARFRGIISKYLKISVLFILASSSSYLPTTCVDTEIFK